MANELAHDLKCTLWEETALTTGMKMALYRDLDKYEMGGESDSDRATDAANNQNDAGGSDREYIPQEYQFEAQEGIETTDSDLLDLVDRIIPLDLRRAKRVFAIIVAKVSRYPHDAAHFLHGFQDEQS